MKIIFIRMGRFLKSLNAPQIMVFGFAVMIAVIAVLLSLPVASSSGKPTAFTEALFTAVSSVCVTGLTVVNTETHWSVFGHAVILIASQIGALGFMTFITLIFLFIGKKITLRDRMLIQQSLNQNDLKGMVRLVKHVLLGTLLIEAIAALILSADFMLREKISLGQALWYGVFHAVCAFSSSGFTILPGDSMTRYVNDPFVCFIVMLLVTLGSLGYTVWIDILTVIKSTHNYDQSWMQRCKHIFRKLSLQSRLVLEITFTLSVIGTLFIFICEWDNPQTLGPLSFPSKWLAALFQSVTPRTLGFHTIVQQDLKYGSRLMTAAFMFVGGSPGGTCGGVKTVTLAVIAAAVYSLIQGRDCMVLHKREIPFNILQKSLAVMFVYLIIILGSTLALTFTEMYNPYSHELFDLIFEVFSATGTVGLSMGITPHLTASGKMVIALCMFLGRIGGITVAISLSSSGKIVNTVRYPECQLIIG